MPVSFSDSTLYLTTEAFGLQQYRVPFTWLLGIRTQAFTLTWQVLFLTERSPQPCSNEFYRHLIPSSLSNPPVLLSCSLSLSSLPSHLVFHLFVCIVFLALWSLDPKGSLLSPSWPRSFVNYVIEQKQRVALPQSWDRKICLQYSPFCCCWIFGLFCFV